MTIPPLSTPTPLVLDGAPIETDTELAQVAADFVSRLLAFAMREYLLAPDETNAPRTTHCGRYRNRVYAQPDELSD